MQNILMITIFFIEQIISNIICSAMKKKFIIVHYDIIFITFQCILFILFY